MSQVVTFSNFKDEKLVSPVKDGTIRDFVCTFFWKLIKKLQDEHDFGNCLKSISSTNIEVIGIEPRFTSRRVPFTEELAAKNYRGIHELLTEVFKDEQKIPSPMIRFMELLLENPVENSYLIARHVAILPRSLRLLLVSNIMIVPRTMDIKVREKYYKILDKVLVSSNWENQFDGSKKKFLTDTFNYGVNAFKDCVYETSCPSVRSYWLLRYMRNGAEHAGISGRTSFVATPEYNSWKQRNAATASLVEKDCYEDVKEPDISLDEVLDALERSFPDVLPEFQEALSEIGYLKYLSINPFDECAPQDSEDEE